MRQAGDRGGRIGRRGRRAMRVLLGLAAVLVLAGLVQLWLSRAEEARAEAARTRAALLLEAQGRLSTLSLAVAAYGHAGEARERRAAREWIGDAGRALQPSAAALGAGAAGAAAGAATGAVLAEGAGGAGAARAGAAGLADAATLLSAIVRAAVALAAEREGAPARDGAAEGVLLSIAKAGALIEALSAEEAARAAARTPLAGGIVATVAGLAFGGAVLVLLVPLLRVAAARERAFARSASALRRAAMTDRLSGLPNRAGFELALDRLLARAAGEPACHGVLLVEVERIDQLTGLFGHEAGEAVLTEVSRRLSRDSAGQGIAARLDGNRIALALRDVEDGEELAAVAERVRGLVLPPVDWQGSECRVGARIGAVLAVAGATDARGALRDASLALARARRTGPQAPVALFAPALRAQAEAHRRTGAELRRALERGEIRPVFQPQVCIATGRLLGVEALARWVPAEGPRRVPSEFLPLAAETGLMTQIDDVMRRSSLRAFRNLRDAGLDPGHLGLNLTLSQLVEPGFLDRLAFDIDAVDLCPADVAIEILESVDLDAAGAELVAVVERLSRAGHMIELDDFGTGHAGLSALRDLPVDRVKIDRSFVTGIEAEPRLQHFTAALVALARRMGVAVLAEGVETEGERAWLARAGCDAVQGFLVSRPLSEEALLHWALARQDRGGSREAGAATG